jgi:hypothetical protein
MAVSASGSNMCLLRGWVYTPSCHKILKRLAVSGDGSAQTLPNRGLAVPKHQKILGKRAKDEVCLRAHPSHLGEVLGQ